MTEQSDTAAEHPDSHIDLSNCEREPIHIPGAIQPHGVLLVLRLPDLTVIQVSASSALHLGLEPAAILGRPVAELVGQPTAAAILEFVAGGKTDAQEPLLINLPGDSEARSFDGMLHLGGNRAILELERRNLVDDVPVNALYAVVRETIAHVEEAETVVDLAQLFAHQMRRLTGFDRVWVYRFHEDWHGEIIAEATDAGTTSWLGMHYPASDIPAQARALFLRNWVRMIPDVHFSPSPLEPRNDPETDEPTDIGGSGLRSVSPIHVEFLRNMGVRASLVISLIHRGKLWGLISGHHYSSAKYVSREMRTVCEFLAQTLSMHIGMGKRTDDRDFERRTRNNERDLTDVLAYSGSLVEALAGGAEAIAKMVDCDGAAVIYGGNLHADGIRPADEDIFKIASWLRSRDADVFETKMLGAEFSPAVSFADTSSGLLAVSLGHDKPDYLLWFRGEQKQVVKWAGDPNKPVTLAPDGTYRLHPRGSFEAWEQQVRGVSAEWLPAEVAAAGNLRRSALQGLLLRRAREVAVLNKELTDLNLQLEQAAVEMEAQTDELIARQEELFGQQESREQLLQSERAARADAERANRAKADFLAVMSHELRTPLNAIGGYAQLMEMGIRGPVTDEQRGDLGRIEASQRYLLGLINSVLNFAKLEAGQVQFDMRPLNVNEVVCGVESLFLPQMQAKGIRYSFTESDESLIVVADEEKLRQIVLNLLTNALKFTESGGTVSMSCGADDDDGEVARVIVSDTGSGIRARDLAAIFEPFVQVDHAQAGGVGLGLAISRDLARKMNGDITAVSTHGAGSIFTVTLMRHRDDAGISG